MLAGWVVSAVPAVFLVNDLPRQTEQSYQSNFCHTLCARDFTNDRPILYMP